MTLRSEFYTAYTPYQAGGRAGDPDDDLRVPVDGLRADRHGCRQRLDVRRRVRGRRGGAARRQRDGPATNPRRRIASIPHHRRILETYGLSSRARLHGCRRRRSRSRRPTWPPTSTPTVAAVLVQQPNFFGIVEEIGPLAEAAHAAGALLIVSADPVALGILEAPGRLGADIVVGEGQHLGNPPSYGGPACGLFACKKELIRRLPGPARRRDGRCGRPSRLRADPADPRTAHPPREGDLEHLHEQQPRGARLHDHPRDARARRGCEEMANLCLQKAHYLEAKLTAIPGCPARSAGSFFLEFALTPARARRRM